jgi:hypothetical protein
MAEIGAAKPDTEDCRGRLQGQIDLVAGVKTDSYAGYVTAKRSLCVH